MREAAILRGRWMTRVPKHAREQELIGFTEKLLEQGFD